MFDVSMVLPLKYHISSCLSQNFASLSKKELFDTKKTKNSCMTQSTYGFSYKMSLRLDSLDSLAKITCFLLFCFFLRHPPKFRDRDLRQTATIHGNYIKSAWILNRFQENNQKHTIKPIK